MLRIFLSSLFVSLAVHSLAFGAQKKSSLSSKSIFYNEAIPSQTGFCAAYKSGKSDKVAAGLSKGGKFLLDSEAIKSLDKKIRASRDAKKKRSYNKQKSAAKKRISYCKSAARSIITRGKATFIVSDISGSGQDSNPLSLQLPASTSDNAAVTCSVLDAPSGINISLQECTLVLTPTTFQPGPIVVRFTARRADGRVSAAKSATARWFASAPFSGDPSSPAPYRKELTPQEVRYVARWFALGATDGMPNNIDELAARLVTPNSSQNCAAVEQDALRVAQTQFNNSSFTVTSGANTITYSSPNDASGKKWWNSQGAMYYMLHMMRYGCDPLRERLALFFINHYNVNLANYNGASGRDLYIKNHLDLVRGKIPGGEGRITAPLQSQLAQLHGSSGAMLAFLDNRANVFPYGNENYARELLELFILGPQDSVTQTKNYTEDDVYELSYATMGWTEKSRPDPRSSGIICCDTTKPGCTDANRCLPINEVYPAFDDKRWNHPTRPRSAFLFSSYPFGKYEVFKSDTTTGGGDNLSEFLTHSHPGVARYFATRLLATFNHTIVDNNLVETVANILRQTNFDFGEAMKFLITSRAVFSPESRSDSIASPTEATMSFIRALDLPLVKATAGNTDYDLYGIVVNGLRSAGQMPTESPSVFGFPEAGKITGGRIHNGEHWLSASSLLARQRMIVSYLNRLTQLLQSAPQLTTFRWEQLLPQNSRDPGAIVDNLALRLALNLSTTDRFLLVEYLSNIALKRSGTNPDPASIRLISLPALSDLEFQNYLKLKMPGLLELLFTLDVNTMK